MTLVPAYGRDYTSKAKLLADWDSDKDFLATGFAGNGYINKSGAQDAGIRTVNIRYAKLRKVAVVSVGGRS